MWKAKKSTTLAASEFERRKYGRIMTRSRFAPPDADAADVTSQALDDMPMKEVKKTRRTFGEYRYPINMDKNQDVIKFTMLKYETKDLMSGGTFGFGNRDRVGPEGGARATGTVVLPTGTEMVMPGDNLKFNVELIAPIAMEEKLRFAIREGGRTVGSGVVSKIVE